jgi:hypothetical protein
MTTFSEPAPAWVPADAWAAYIEVREAKHRKCPFTPLARKRILEKLLAWHGQGMDIAEVLWRSAESGWTGVFPVKARAPVSQERNQSSTDEARRLLGLDDDEVIDAQERVQPVRRAA